MENEYMKRGYLLPEGCKDLNDVAKFKVKQMPEVLLSSLPDKVGSDNATAQSGKQSAALPPISRQVFISADTTVGKLAALLGQKPFKIICELLQLGTFASVDDLLDFKIISRVARMHGFQAIKGA